MKDIVNIGVRVSMGRIGKCGYAVLYGKNGVKLYESSQKKEKSRNPLLI